MPRKSTRAKSKPIATVAARNRVIGKIRKDLSSAARKLDYTVLKSGSGEGTILYIEIDEHANLGVYIK